MNIGSFTKEHVVQTLGLSMQVGWNHIEEDWLRCVALNPQGCLGGFVEGRLVATTTFLQFGELGWMGTFIVDRSLRKKGDGSRMLEEAMRLARAKGCTWFAVDSSDVGRPIYTRLGFVLNEPIERWTGPNGGEADGQSQRLAESHWEAVLKLDRKSVGVDREKQLRRLAGEPGAAARVLVQDERMVGFGFSRKGRLSGSVGPLVAQGDEAAQKVLVSLLADRRALDGEGSIAMDVLGHEKFKEFLVERGIGMRRRNIRMFCPGKKRDVLSGANAYAATGLGMG